MPSAVSRWDRILLFGGLNLAAIALFVVCFTLLPLLATRPRKFAILYVLSLFEPLVLSLPGYAAKHRGVVSISVPEGVLHCRICLRSQAALRIPNDHIDCSRPRESMFDIAATRRAIGGCGRSRPLMQWKRPDDHNLLVRSGVLAVESFDGCKLQPPAATSKGPRVDLSHLLSSTALLAFVVILLCDELPGFKHSVHANSFILLFTTTLIAQPNCGFTLMNGQMVDGLGAVLVLVGCHDGPRRLW